ncbi:MAG: transporter permease, partial [Microvirga sp.]|nr:transporter permease [Microvirga sp.]
MDHSVSDHHPAAAAEWAKTGASRFRVGSTAFASLLMTPAAIVMALFYFVPLLQVLWTSVTDPTPGLGNYAQLFSSPSIHRVLLTTARICVETTIVTLVLGYLLAYAITQSAVRTQRIILLAVVLPMWISVLVRAFGWVTLLQREGIINSLLLSANVITEPLSLVWNEFGIAIGMVHYMIPYAVLPLYAVMRDIDPRCMAAARSLGANRTQAFVKVFLPLSKMGILGAGTLVLIYSVGFFTTPAILGGGKTLMVAEYISVQIVEVLRWGIGTMLASSLIVAVLLLVVLVSRVMNVQR